jgi:outer membrane cobalamin receptor
MSNDRFCRRLPVHIPLAMSLLAACGAWAQVPTQTVEVVGTSPLPGLGVDRDALPYSTLLLRRAQLDAMGGDTLVDAMARRWPGVQVNDIQGSPYQGDLTFRGFRASGLLGAAQGLSVYLDGVRINEPFGDVVNWDLLPEFALESVALVPGASPAFGLNTLGGALVATTADGRSRPGSRLESGFGSFGRKRLEATVGGATGSRHDGSSWFLGAGAFDETGWRDHSPGRIGSVMAKLEAGTALGQFSASALVARSRLVGNGLVPWVSFDDDEPGEREPDLGALRRSAVYTHPDLTRNRLTQWSLGWRRSLDGGALLEALAYQRKTRRSTINGDEAEEVEEGEEDLNASLNRTNTGQTARGVSVAVSGHHGPHQWQLGLAADRSRVSYEQTEQEGRFDASRGVTAGDEEAEFSAGVAGRSRSLGLYLTDTWRLASGTHLTAALRWNQVRVANRLTVVDDDTDEVESHEEESFDYRSLNPALGIAHKLAGGPTVFANLARNSRAPTVIELGCADPEEPCRLPAGLQADPYLAPVRSTSFEAGLRLPATAGWGGSMALYRTDNRNDILFSSVSVNGQLGYFRNFDRTRHQGLDTELNWRGAVLDVGLGISLLDATYQAAGTLRIGERNVAVAPGTRIAGLPRRMLKASVDWRLAAGWSLGADLQAVSRRGSAGNEDGRFEDDEQERQDFSVPGHALVHVRASWRPAASRGLELAARVHNLFDRRSASFGALAQTLFDSRGAYSGQERSALFVAPGAPRSVQLTLRTKF